MSSSDEDMKGGNSPTVSDSDVESISNGSQQGTKRKKSTKSSTKISKKARKSTIMDDSEDETPQKNKFIDDEASESDDGQGGGGSEDESGDDGEDKDEYYMNDGFVVDEDSDDDEIRDRNRRRRKKKDKKLKRLKKRDLQVDDEDLLLVRENMGIETGPNNSRQDDESDEDDIGGNEQQRSSSKRTKLQNELISRDLSYRYFGDSDEEEERAPASRNNYLGNDEYESDDIDEFIVDDDEEGRDGAPMRRRRKQAPLPPSMQGPSVYQMDEAEELFGDMDQFMEAARGEALDDGSIGGKKKSAKDALKEKFEPSVLKEHMMTPEVIGIRDLDMPERYQRIFRNRKFPDAEERADESEWIGDSILKSMEKKGQMTMQMSRGEIVSAIDAVLRFYHDEKLEPEFVKRYCKEHWKPSGLHSEHLDAILDLDIKWDKLDRKKKSFQAGMNRIVDASSGKVSDFVRECYEKLLQTPNEKSFQDLSEFLALDAPESSIDISNTKENSKVRRPMRRSFYQICTKGGLRSISDAFTMNASVFGGILVGMDIYDESLKEIPTPETSPAVFAYDYVSTEFPESEDAMKGARHIAARKVACEPNVRKAVRDLYRAGAVVYTDTTAKGKDDIDEFHYCHGLQYLEEMPVMDILENGGDLWLRLTRAEKEELITITIVNHKGSDLVDQLVPVYLDQKADANEEWQTQRHLVLEEAVGSFITSFENEIRRDLLIAAREVVAKRCGNAMRERLLVRPYEISGDEYIEPYIIAIWIDGGVDAVAHAVALDTNGELIDKTEGSCRRDQKSIHSLTQAIYTFLLEHARTNVVVINVSAGQKCMDMGNLVDAVRAQLKRESTDSRDYLDVVLLKDDIPAMYSRSKRAEIEFPEESESVRAAVGLGRYLRNPASELSALWGNVALDEPTRGHDLLYLSTDVMQHSLVRDMLLREYDRVFVQVINKFGVDINLLANHKHASYQLQFVCGLGPVKATSILDKVRAKSFVQQRQELLTKGFLGKVVYRNCAGFIRIRERDALRDIALNPLDDTRVHPESYYMAVKMCGDANNNTTIDMYDPQQYSVAVEDTMYQSSQAIQSRQKREHHGNEPQERMGDAMIQDALSELDLVTYASRLEQQNKGPKLLTLEYIKRELRYPYFDKRFRYKPPTDEELFYLLNQESKDSLKIGMIIPCTLMHAAGRQFVRVKLQNNIRASLSRNLLPEYMLKDEEEYIHKNGFPEGMIVNAKILDLRKDQDHRYELVLGCDDRSILDVAACFNRDRFPQYTNSSRVENDSRDRLEKLVNREAKEDAGQEMPVMDGRKPSRRKKRQIAHPLFQNINSVAALTYLRDEPVGSVCLRPSSLGTDHITLTWKMLDGVYRHFDILEKNKPSDARLGEQLVIKEETYSSIDELNALFVEPMNRLVEDVTTYKYYKNISLEKVHEDLIKQKKANPSRIPYIIHLYDQFPGCFSLTFIARTTPHSCHMEVKPGGLRFFGRIESALLPTLNQAIQFFKMKALVAPTAKQNPPVSSSYETNDYHRRQSTNRDGGSSRWSHRGDRHFESRYDSRGNGGYPPRRPYPMHTGDRRDW